MPRPPKKPSDASINDMARLQAILEKLGGVKVLLAGDVMLDRYVTGTVDRISPESPVPVLSARRGEDMLGGAGSTLANLAGLGAQAHIFSVTGDDAPGRRVHALLRALGFSGRGVVTDAKRATIRKTRFMAGHQQLLRVDEEETGPVAANIIKKILMQAEKTIPGVHAVILSDYGKGLLQPELIQGLIKIARRHKIPVIVDPKGRDFSIYRGADIITPNRKELAEAAGMDRCDDDAQVIAAARKIIKTCDIGAVVATRSADGMSVIPKSGAVVHLRGAPIDVYDVSGAGDAVIATLGAALAAGASLTEAAYLSNLAGRIAVTKIGAAPVRIDEVQSALEEDSSGFAFADKKAPVARTMAAALDVVRRWRARGLTIGLTNGCFDILHAGHVSYLNAARGKCDRLIVGLNRDESVRILKGQDRPVHDEDARAAVLAALACVDMVVLFGAHKQGDDNTASALLKSLAPDLYIKGGDYKPGDIPEAPAVKAVGAKLVLMPHFAGHSTTGSISRIRRRK